MKHCPKCHRDMDISCFSRNKKHSDGLDCRCRACAVIAARLWRAKNKEYVTAQRKQHYLLHYEIYKARNDNRYRALSEEQRREQRRQYYLANRKRILASNLASKLRRQREGHRAIHAVRTALTKAIQRGHLTKSGRTFDLLGYAPAEFLAHLAKQFRGGMSWGNYGEWEIDHIIPISSLEIKTLEDVAKANALPNLRPCWKQENRKKSANIITLL